MLFILLLIALLAGVDAPLWVWLAVIIGEPLFWLVVINVASPPDGY